MWLSGHGGHHDPSEAVHGRSAGSGGRRQEERDGGCCFQNCEEVFAEKILIKMTIPGGAEGSGAEAILLSTFPDGKHRCKVAVLRCWKRFWGWYLNWLSWVNSQQSLKNQMSVTVLDHLELPLRTWKQSEAEAEHVNMSRVNVNILVHHLLTGPGWFGHTGESLCVV